jgi:hypothetical protein
MLAGEVDAYSAQRFGKFEGLKGSGGLKVVKGDLRSSLHDDGIADDSCH